jgi:hypothetical protein
MNPISRSPVRTFQYRKVLAGEVSGTGLGRLPVLAHSPFATVCERPSRTIRLFSDQRRSISMDSISPTPTSRCRDRPGTERPMPGYTNTPTLDCDRDDEYQADDTHVLVVQV